MPKTRFSAIILALLFLNITLFSSVNVLACSCYIPLVCEQYSFADSVFIGKLEKLEESNLIRPMDTIAYFSVEKTYKGKTDKLELVGFYLNGSCERKLIVGEKYFVYKEVSNLPNPCNRTELLSQMKYDLEYAESLSETNPIFTIRGRLENLSKEDIKSSEILIELGQSKQKATLDNYGNFEFTAKTNGIYHIKMTLPFDAKTSMMMCGGEFNEEDKGFKIKHTDKQTIIEYDLEFKPNSCDYRSFFFNKDYKSVQKRN